MCRSKCTISTLISSRIRVLQRVEVGHRYRTLPYSYVFSFTYRARYSADKLYTLVCTSGTVAIRLGLGCRGRLLFCFFRAGELTPSSSGFRPDPAPRVG